LNKLGYRVIVPNLRESGRTYLSKGMLKKAKSIAHRNVRVLKDLITIETPIIGIEPSAILTLRDEYIDLTNGNTKKDAGKIAESAFTIDEFIEKEIRKGKISSDLFTEKVKKIKLHGHCHQKAIASTSSIIKMLSLPKNYQVEEIPSGCCGMAGAFGFEEEHYEISQKIGELVLFPYIRNTDEDEIICAPGTSCRHQINEGTGKNALHPIEILYDALINKSTN
jgi:Fe-S oxidoreductase